MSQIDRRIALIGLGLIGIDILGLWISKYSKDFLSIAIKGIYRILWVKLSKNKIQLF